MRGAPRQLHRSGECTSTARNGSKTDMRTAVSFLSKLAASVRVNTDGFYRWGLSRVFSQSCQPADGT
jgi:hypothetical protein